MNYIGYAIYQGTSKKYHGFNDELSLEVKDQGWTHLRLPIRAQIWNLVQELVDVQLEEEVE